LHRRHSHFGIQMLRNRRFQFALLALLVGLMTVPLFGAGSTADAGSGVKFFVVEWRLTWEKDGKEIIKEDGSIQKVLVLKIRGRASLDGRDFDKDFEMEVADATPYLEILRTCGMGRMSGTVDDYTTEGSTVIGKDLDTMACRAILK
jgi:hypothetical protein